MKHITLPLILSCAALASQAQTVTLTFEGTMNGSATPLDSIRVSNLSQGGDTTIVFPNNILELGTTGVPEDIDQGTVFLNMPNPFVEATDIVVGSGRAGELVLAVHDAMGREVAAERVLAGPGQHRFRFTASAPGIHLVTLVHHGQRHGLRMMALGEGTSSAATLTYVGGVDRLIASKTDRAAFAWSAGDELRYIGYAASSGIVHSDAIDEVPLASATHTFILLHGAVCPDAPRVADIDGNAYRTVHLAGQCWTAHELRTGTYSNGDPIPSVSDPVAWAVLTTGAWCHYNDIPSTEVPYGRLYNWYVASDARNVCPAGWHVPTDADWQTLELAVGMTPMEVMGTGIRGIAENIGGKLKSAEGWHPVNSANTNASGFTAMPTGWRNGGTGIVTGQPQVGYWWAADTDTNGEPWMRTMHFGSPGIVRASSLIAPTGLGIRCVRD